MLEFFSMIGDAVSSVLTYFMNMVQNFVNVILLIPRANAFLQSIIIYVPPFISVFIGLGIALSVVLFFINR